MRNEIYYKLKRCSEPEQMTTRTIRVTWLGYPLEWKEIKNISEQCQLIMVLGIDCRNVFHKFTPWLFWMSAFSFMGRQLMKWAFPRASYFLVLATTYSTTQENITVKIFFSTQKRPFRGKMQL